MPKEFKGLFRSRFDTFVVVDKGNGHQTTLPKRVYIDADYRPSYDRLPILDDGFEDETDNKS